MCSHGIISKKMLSVLKYIISEMIETFLSYFSSRILGSKRGGYSKVVENVGKARFLVYKGCTFEKKSYVNIL